MGKRRTNGFTLVEMLTVLVIVAIMVGLAIPAVTTLMKAGGLSAATREVANTLNLARQLAITQRTYARVVFPYSQTGSQPDMWYHTYAVMINRDNTVAAGWSYASKWEYLPIGAVFLNTAAGLTASGLGALDDANSLNQQGNLPFPIPGNSGNLGQFAYIEFGPTGAASPLTSGGGGTLAITEGFTSLNGSTATPTPTTTRTSSNTLANVTIISVDSLIGRVQVTRP
jgi:prepilin-type N-terminal cleavage/methylation domain-containing protein